MLKGILERQINNLVDKDVRGLNKALSLIVIAAYTLTIVQLQKYVYVIESLISPNNNLDLSQQVLSKLITSILAVAGYFLLLEIADFLQAIASQIVISIDYLVKHIFKIYSEPEIYKKYRYDRNIVRDYDVERYLEINQDDRVKKILENHKKWETHLMNRKRDVMAISTLLALNFYLNYEKFNIMSDYTRPYWLIIIGLTIWSGILPYEDMMFIYIHNNKIRDGDTK